MSSVVTFGRRRKPEGSGGPADSCSGSVACAPRGALSSASASETFVTAASVLTPVPESPAGVEEQDENAVVSSRPANPNRWRRKNAAERQEAERRQYLAEMRAHFEEVDAFELAVETPPAARVCAEAAPMQPSLQGGVAQALAAAAPTPGTAHRQRPMSLGLSRRRSSMVPWAHTALASSSKANASPLKLGILPSAAERQPDGVIAGRRSTVGPAGMHRLSMAGDNAGLASPGWAGNRHSLAARGRRSSAAPSRLSSTGHMLSRLSLGLTDALQWLGIKGKIPTTAAGEGSALAGAEAAADSNVIGRAAPEKAMLSPIASPGLEEGSDTPVERSASPGSIAAPDLVEDRPEPEAGAGACSPPAAAWAMEQLSTAAEEDKQASPSPAPSEGAADGREPALELAAPEASTDAADKQQNMAEVEELEVQLAAKLHLEDQAGAEQQPLTAEEEAAEEASMAAGLAEVETAGREAEAAVETLGTQAEAEELTPLQQLLVLCGQETNVNLLPSMDELLGQHVDLKKVRKIGEGTFGEAFKAGGVVLKLVPMEGSVLVNGEPQKRADEILAEVSVTLTLSRLNGAAADPGKVPDNVTSGFVETFGVGVCRGAYSEALRQEWHRWDEENGSENEAVDIFCGDQLFVVFVVADGGADLEHFQLRSFDEVRSILLQTVLAVAVAEEACEFEHRDLHWGNLLIRRSEEPAPTSAVRARLRGVELEAATQGVTVTLIDFTLSRLVTVTGEVAFCDLAADPYLFKGPKGSVQAETYRRMKKATKNKWEAHVPATNVFWMQYLVDICMTEKKGWSCRKEDLNELRSFKRRILTYPNCSELLFDEFLRAGLIVSES